MKLKRTVAVILTLILTVSMVLVASTASGEGFSGTVNFYFWDEAQKDAMEAIAEGFEAKNPNVTVECTVIPFADYVTKLRTSLPSGTGPDVFWINKTSLDVQEYIAPIQDRAAADGVDMGNYVDAIVNMFTVDGNLYGMPKDVDAPALFYNKKIFDAAGVPYPTDDWKWEDMREAAIKLTQGNVYGLAAHCQIYDGIYNYLPCNGAFIFNDDRTEFTANTPAGIEAVQYMLDLMYVDKCSPTQAEMTEFGPEDMFSAGMVAMIINGSWKLRAYHDVYGEDLGLAMVPYNTERVYQSNGLAYAMSATSKNPDLAWEFLKYLGSKEAQELQAGVAIPALKGCEEKWMENYSDINVTPITNAMNYSIELYRAAINRSECAEKITEAFANMWLQSVDPATGLAELEKTIFDLTH